AEPTATPTAEPTATPTAEPTATPTAEPTATPTTQPTAQPTATPTAVPTATPAPTATPTLTPIPTPTATPEPIVAAVQEIVNNFFQEEETEIKAEIEVEKSAEGTVSVVIAPTESKEDGTLALNLTADVISNLSNNEVGTLSMKNTDTNAQVVVNDIAAIIDEIQVESADSVVVEFDNATVATTLEEIHEVVKNYEVTNVCNVAVTLISGNEKKPISNEVKGLTVRLDSQKTVENPIILFVDAETTITELEGIWHEAENGTEGYWEIPYVGVGTYLLANRIETAE
ncbi:MAG: hypothetical protein ACI4WX_11955, partial [Aristaeellaceae bacterium]